mmetsp:Transcript_36721/g.113213  ORF Transcript_36721/g.113213 Transcript_36721/m.113213 type:complete len:205 (-) Transcript_36721:532-1146(-)
MARIDVRALLGQDDLDGGWPPRNERRWALANPLETSVHLPRINVSLNDVEHGDVASLLQAGADHHVVRHQQPPHHIVHRCLLNRRRYCAAVQRHRRIASAHEMAPRCGHKRRKHTHHVVVHVTWVTQGGRRCRHHGTHQSVHLLHRGLVNVKRVHNDTIKSCVVQHDHAVGVLGQVLHREKAVVRLNNHVTCVTVATTAVVRKH